MGSCCSSEPLPPPANRAGALGGRDMRGGVVPVPPATEAPEVAVRRRNAPRRAVLAPDPDRTMEHYRAVLREAARMSGMEGSFSKSSPVFLANCGDSAGSTASVRSTAHAPGGAGATGGHVPQVPCLALSECRRLTTSEDGSCGQVQHVPLPPLGPFARGGRHSRRTHSGLRAALEADTSPDVSREASPLRQSDLPFPVEAAPGGVPLCREMPPLSPPRPRAAPGVAAPLPEPSRNRAFACCESDAHSAAMTSSSVGGESGTMGASSGLGGESDSFDQGSLQSLNFSGGQRGGVVFLPGDAQRLRARLAVAIFSQGSEDKDNATASDAGTAEPRADESPRSALASAVEHAERHDNSNGNGNGKDEGGGAAPQDATAAAPHAHANDDNNDDDNNDNNDGEEAARKAAALPQGRMRPAHRDCMLPLLGAAAPGCFDESASSCSAFPSPASASPALVSCSPVLGSDAAPTKDRSESVDLSSASVSNNAAGGGLYGMSYQSTGQPPHDAPLPGSLQASGNTEALTTSTTSVRLPFVTGAPLQSSLKRRRRHQSSVVPSSVGAPPVAADVLSSTTGSIGRTRSRGVVFSHEVPADVPPLARPSPRAKPPAPSLSPAVATDGVRSLLAAAAVARGVGVGVLSAVPLCHPDMPSGWQPVAGGLAMLGMSHRSEASSATASGASSAASSVATSPSFALQCRRE